MKYERNVDGTVEALSSWLKSVEGICTEAIHEIELWNEQAAGDDPRFDPTAFLKMRGIAEEVLASAR